MLRTSIQRFLLILAWMLALGVALMFIGITVTGRQEATANAQERAAGLASVMEENIRRTFDFYDRSLQGVVQEVSDPATMALPPEFRDRVIFDKAVAVPGLSGVAVVDAAGTVVNSTEARATRGISVSERDYFQLHRDHADLGLHVSAPVASKYNGEPVVALSRRRISEDGRFAGVVIVQIRVRYFNEVLASGILGPGARITLLRKDGIVISRHPYDPRLIGTSLAQGVPVQRFFAGETFFEETSDVDGAARLFYFKAFSQYPLVVAMAQSSQAVYADWYRRSLWIGTAAIFLMASCLGLAWLFLRELDDRQKIAQQLRTAERDLRTMLDGLPSMVAYWDRNLLIRYANNSYTRHFGAPSSAAPIGAGMPRAELSAPAPAGNAHHVEKALRGERQAFETPVVDGVGQRRHLLVSFVPDLEAGEVQGVFVQGTDITERKAAEQLLFDEKERARVTLASIGEAVITADADGHVTYLNPVAEKVSGWTLDEARGRDVETVVPLRDGPSGAAHRTPIRTALSERRIVAPSGSASLVNRGETRFDIEETAAPIEDRDGRVVGAVMVLRDVTMQRAMALRMAHLAHYDALTGLPNRVLLHDRAAQAIARGRRDGASFALMYLDLDGFKDVNDSLGHDAGDRLLVEFAQRLTHALRQSDTLSRQGGDEFVVLAPLGDDEEAAQVLAAKLVRLSAQPFLVEGRELRVTTSLGIACYPLDGETFDTLSRHADAAMYSAKRAGKNQYRFYTGDIGREADQQLLRDHVLGAG